MGQKRSRTRHGGYMRRVILLGIVLFLPFIASCSKQLPATYTRQVGRLATSKTTVKMAFSAKTEFAASSVKSILIATKGNIVKATVALIIRDRDNKTIPMLIILTRTILTRTPIVPRRLLYQAAVPSPMWLVMPKPAMANMP